MTALAAETKNVRVGCLVFCAWAPATRASWPKPAVTIDHVSNGRLELGIGYGPWGPEYRRLWTRVYLPMKTQMDILEEAAPRSSRSMLHNGTTTFQGKHFQIR